MKIVTVPEDQLMMKIKRETEELQKNGAMIKYIELSEDEYQEIKKDMEVDAGQDFVTMFGLPLNVNGRNPAERSILLAQAQAPAKGAH